MTLAVDGKWVWDFWLARDGRDWHAYFLQADKSLGDRDVDIRTLQALLGLAKLATTARYTCVATGLISAAIANFLFRRCSA